MRRLPIGVQDFEDMITSGYVYVDKTDLVYKLVTESKQYFLGRPRRFGKSLLISTLKAYFQGKRELFRGLAIEELEKEWKQHPVIHLDMTRAGVNFDNFEYRLIDRLKFHEKLWNLPGDEKNDAATRFYNLVANACEKSGERVVVLVDEYDKQLVEHIGDRELNDLFRAKLKDFYGV
ncbi:MAG: AAA family ATPase, partial [Gracilibacteraceae bacterium]|nr:AAA family ATPase [Gracilibacteraceae bacterium]